MATGYGYAVLAAGFIVNFSSASFASVVASIAAIVAALLGYLNNRKINEVHLLVNSQLDRALKRISDLEEMVRELGDSSDPNA